MSSMGEMRRRLYRLRRGVRRAVPRTRVRLPGARRRRRDRGQGAIEYVGLTLVVVAIVGALIATGVGPDLAQKMGVEVCKVTGGDNCGGGGGDSEAQDGGTNGTGKGDAASDRNDDGSPKSPAQIDYDKALKDLQDAQKDEKSNGDKALDAAKELAKILADELGITDALDCITKGDMGACTETLINVLLSLIGGAVGKLAAKYGAPWKWKKAYKLIQALKKHGGDLYDGLKGLVKSRKKVKGAEKALEDAGKKLDGEKKPPSKKDDKPDEKKPTTCPAKHSFLAGTPVLLADGRTLAIEAVRPGDLVTATDPVTGRTAARRVERTITTYDDKHFTRLTVETGGAPARLTATDTHPFWLSGERRWEDAGDIGRGDTLRTETGGTLTVTGVTRYTQRQTTYDLTVQGVHTYYVGIGSVHALVHNNDCDMSPEEVGAAREPSVGEGDPKKFKDHFQRHKKLVEDALGTKYKKLKEDGPQFRKDIADAIKDGTFELVGKGTLKKGEPEGLIYRGKGVTIVLKENGDFWTALKTGEGMDTGIVITKKVPKKK
ncbi:polymorphic toxin-type HINT domain-containing protein [Streptomyces sp. ITFR-16]|uniref:polymorphic toxin-type HINT domain-containing protein n=1 Tax=Streptomyces sp. ITFR-16 TaxID=3075198 RepID=UPI00288AE8F5|nr:polymorphic toxin-type HINT domain-containing protein [Streptomyces sp. ITFR-16]WNI22768.1 polymorphic toxin-type HINT domain-containing protein [Streptomyces sp. ITFR-16]